MPRTIDIMTARYVPGDAIGHYIDIQRRLFREADYGVNIFSDGAAGGHFSMLSHRYVPTADDLLWFHYSIYADNFRLLTDAADRRVLDFHGVCPPEHFAGYDENLAALARRGREVLPDYAEHFDLCVVHSDYTKGVLENCGYRNVVKSPLVAKRDLLESPDDPALSAELSKLEYLIFVGRLTPQKNLFGALRLYQRLAAERPDLRFFIIGGGSNTPEYARELRRWIEREGLVNKVCLTGPIVNPALLKSFFRHARLQLMLSHWETFCVPIVEAMGFGVPTVGGDNTAIPETIGDSGVVARSPEDDDAVARCLQLLEDEAEYGALSERCRRRAAAFTEEALRPRLLELAERVWKS